MRSSYWAKAFKFNFSFFNKLLMTLWERFAQRFRPAFYFGVSCEFKLFKDIGYAATCY